MLGLETRYGLGVIIITNDENTLDRLSVGSRVKVLANHSCLTAAQYPCYNVLEGENVVDQWQTHSRW